MDMLKEVVTAVVVGLAPVIAALVMAILVRLLQRVGLDVSAEQQAKVEKTVQDVVLRAEEWGAQRLKGKLGVTAGQKLVRATEEILERVPGLTRDQAVALIHQELPKLRLGAALDPRSTAPESSR